MGECRRPFRSVECAVPKSEFSSPLPYLGMALRHYRLQNAFTQTEFGQQVGLSQAYVYFLESGRRRPSLDMLDRLCNRLNIPMSALLSKAESLAAEATAASSAETSAQGS